MSRSEHIKDEGGTLKFPDLYHAQYLFDAFSDIGPLVRNSDGSVSQIGWKEISEYSIATGRKFKAFEAEILKGMGRAFLKGFIDGEDPLSKEPMLRDQEEE